LAFAKPQQQRAMLSFRSIARYFFYRPRRTPRPLKVQLAVDSYAS